MSESHSAEFNTKALEGSAGRTRRKKMGFRGKSMRNLLTMGHCAPAVMKTVLEICGSAARRVNP